MFLTEVVVSQWVSLLQAFIRFDNDEEYVITDVSTSGDEDVFTDVSTSDKKCVISAKQDPDLPVPVWTSRKAVNTITNQELHVQGHHVQQLHQD